MRREVEGLRIERWGVGGKEGQGGRGRGVVGLVEKRVGGGEGLWGWWK